MSKIFDPAPTDKHADSETAALDADKARHRKPEQGLEGNGPASEPVSAAQPAKSKSDAHPSVIEDGEGGPRHARHPA
jgi:hypothetical protein